MAQDNRFAKYVTQQPQQTPGIILGRPKEPDPIAVQGLELRRNSDARAAEAADRSAAAADRAAAAQERTASNTTFDNTSGLRKEFNALPEIKDFSGMRASRNRIVNIVQNPDPTAQDDIALVFSYMKMLDPGSVVREGEYATAQTATGVPAQILNTYNKLLTGERLNPDQRMNMARSATGVYHSQRDIFNERAKYYRELAQKQGLDPDAITGFYKDVDQPQGENANLPSPDGTKLRPVGDFAWGEAGKYSPPGALDYVREVEDGIRTGTITNADGVNEVARKYGLREPDRAAVDKAFDQLSKGAKFGGVGIPEYASVVDARAEMARTRSDAVVDPALRGVADTVTLGGSDEIAGIITAIAEGGNVREQIALQRAKADFDEQNNFGPRLTGQIVGGAALPTGGARSVGQLAKVGGAYGAGYGFGSGDGSLGERVLGAGNGAVIGAGSAATLGALGNGVSRLGSGGPPGGGGNAAGREVYDAAIAAGITDDAGRAMVLPADVGGPMTRRLTSGAMQTVFGSGPVIRGAEAAQGRAGQRLAEIAGAAGTPARQEVLGEVGHGAAQGYIDRTQAASRRMYDEARDLANDSMAQGRRAFRNLNAQIRELAPTQSVDAPVIAGLTRLRDVIASDNGLESLSIDSIRRLRTSTAAEARVEGLRGTDYQRRAGMVLDELSEDIASQLPREAADAFRRADRAYAERLNTIDDVMERVVGRTGDSSAEGVANRLISMSRGDSARLRSFLNAVEPEEAGIVRGSLIQEMGRATSGAQNAEGSGFSLQTFLTNWDKMPARTKDTLFRGEHRDAIEGLARYAQAVRETRGYANASNTGGAVNAQRVLSGGAAMTTLGSSAVLENLTGRLLGSRRFAQWLARAPRDPTRQQAWAQRLGTIATREPALAQDLIPLREALESSVSRAAASDQEQNRR